MFNPTAETLALAKAALRSGLTKEEALAKGVTVGTGLVYYDLQAPAKNLYPVITPLRNSIPRVGRPVGYSKPILFSLRFRHLPPSKRRSTRLRPIPATPSCWRSRRLSSSAALTHCLSRPLPCCRSCRRKPSPQVRRKHLLSLET